MGDAKGLGPKPEKVGSSKAAYTLYAKRIKNTYAPSETVWNSGAAFVVNAQALWHTVKDGRIKICFCPTFEYGEEEAEKDG